MHNPWTGIISPPLALKSEKPGKNRLTMVIDKGLGIYELSDLLETAGSYMDYLKLGFGTSALYKPEFLQAKLELCKNYGVVPYPGGTLMETAFYQGNFDTFLRRAVKLGFSIVEISDGTIKLEKKDRLNCIRQAVDAGFSVITEVGKKDASKPLQLTELLNMAEEDLAAGAWKVIIEARESGKGIGIYDADGAVINEKLEGIAAKLADLSQIIWEAPLKNQQVELITRFGPNVNLGNIQPSEVIALEALRQGLRSDTFRLSFSTSTPKNAS